MRRQGRVKRAPALALVATLALWSSEVDAFGVGLGATRATTTMGMGNSFGRLFRISTWGESHGGGVGVNLDGCPPKIPLSAEDIQVGACGGLLLRAFLSRIDRGCPYCNCSLGWGRGAAGDRMHVQQQYHHTMCSSKQLSGHHATGLLACLGESSFR